MASRAKSFLRWLGILFAVLILAGVALVLGRDPILRRIEERSIYESTGLRAEIGEFHSTLGSAAFVVRDLKLYNLAEFGGSLMAWIPELAVDVDASKVARGSLHFRSLRLNLAELHVVKSAAGRYNLDGMEKAVREHIERRRHRRPGEKQDLDFDGIDQLKFTLRHVRYTDLQDPRRTRSFDLGVDDEVVTTLKTEEDLQYWIGGLVFRVLVQQSLRNFESHSRGGRADTNSPRQLGTNAPAPGTNQPDAARGGP
jgi:hypothetical protein